MRDLLIIFVFIIYAIRWITYGIEVSEMRKSKWLTIMAATALSREEVVKGRRFLEKALSEKYIYPESFLKYGLLLFNNNEPYKALPYMEKAYLYLPWKEVIYKILAEIYSEIGSPSKALWFARTYLKWNRSFEAQLWFAYILLKNGKTGDAFFLLKELKQQQPSNPTVLLLYGLSLYYQGLEKDAIFLWKKALQLSPDKEKLKKILTSASSALSPEARKKLLEFLKQVP